MVGNGNMASRILPVKIQILDAEDKRLLEHELEVLRAIDFVYKEAGVNRPLKVDDKEEKNIGGTKYTESSQQFSQCSKGDYFQYKKF